MGDQQIAPLLESILNNTEEGRGCRTNAARTLGQIHSEASIPLLRSVIANESENDNVRKGAAQALAWLDDREALPLLIQLFRTSPSLAIQEDVLRSIIQLGGDAIFELLMQIVLDPQNVFHNVGLAKRRNIKRHIAK